MFPQLYAELFLPIGQGLSVKAGHYFGIVGWEVQSPPDHLFYSYGYLAYFAIPFQFTGVQCTYPLTDQLTLSSGVNRGGQVFEDNNNALSYLGGLTWVSASQKTTAHCALLTGPEQDEPGATYSGITGLPGESLNRSILTVYLMHELSPGWTYVIHHDFGIQELSRADPEPSAEWYGVAQFLTWQLTGQWAVGLRGEWFRDDDGTRVSGFRSMSHLAPADYYDITLGCCYTPNSSIAIKQELRWDWQDLDDDQDQPAFDAGQSTSQFLVATELVVKF